MPKPPLPKIAPITLEGFTLDLNYYLNREYDEVGEAALDLPSVAEWVNEQLQSFTESHQTAKIDLAEAEAEVYFNLKKGQYAEDYGSEKPTSDSMNHAVNIDLRVRKLNHRIAILYAWCQRLRGIQENLRMKLELVRSTEATRRVVFDQPSQS